MQIKRKPEWLRKKISLSDNVAMERLLSGLQLNTVCQAASCPNISECFRQQQATFLVMGKDCTRHCSFCNVAADRPAPLDPDEPARLAVAVQQLALKHLVITSPTRDDLSDGGAAHYAATIAAVRNAAPQTRIELLVPDFAGNADSLAAVLAAGPDILGHNIETVPRLYAIRAGADYRRSLRLLSAAAASPLQIPVKSGIMLGLGETADEVRATLGDIAATGCRFLSIGQYLAPSRQHHPVIAYIEPAEFDRWRDEALSLGFSHVESGPYVRSSYHAGDYPAYP